MTMLFDKSGDIKPLSHEPKKLNPANVLQVHLLEAKPNKMFHRATNSVGALPSLLTSG